MSDPLFGLSDPSRLLISAGEGLLQYPVFDPWTNGPEEKATRPQVPSEGIRSITDSTSRCRRNTP